MCLIAKALACSSQFYKNRGLIVRKNFSDLYHSTIKDFEELTGLTVHTTHKLAIVPHTQSIIMFRHAKEISNQLIQNLNLGWFGIEQAEEFDTAVIFDMLRGRMRRIVTPIMRLQELWVKRGYIPEVHPEWQNLPEDVLNEWERSLKSHGVHIRQGYIIANCCGHNWVWRRWKYEQWHNYELHEAVSFDNPHLPEDTIEDFARMKEESPRRYNRYVLNSWEDYDIEGAYYASLMSEALKEKRVGISGLWDPTLPCYTFWDLGVRDSTSIWVAQFPSAGIRLVDYYENYGEPINHYTDWLSQQKYTYAAHYLPHDAKQRIQGSEKVQTRYQMIIDLRKKAKNEAVIVCEPHSLENGIDEVRGVIPMCHWDQKCRKGVECLNHYRRKINEALTTDEHTEFVDRPLHDWASHGADAFRIMAVAYRYHKIGGKILGYKGSKPLHSRVVDKGTEDLLEI